MANENRAIPKQKPLGTELWYVDMYTESRRNFFVRDYNVKDSRLRLNVPREPMVIHIKRAIGAGDAKDHIASTTVSPGTEARLNSAARPSKRRFIQCGGQVYLKTNDPTGPCQRMPKVARTGSATTDPSMHTVPQSVADRNKEYVSKMVQSIEDNNKPTEPVPRADVPGPKGTL